jgi:hypothetical protein
MMSSSFNWVGRRYDMKRTIVLTGHELVDAVSLGLVVGTGSADEIANAFKIPATLLDVNREEG